MIKCSKEKVLLLHKPVSYTHLILMAYAIIKVFFANLKRGGILLIQIAVGLSLIHI